MFGFNVHINIIIHLIYLLLMPSLSFGNLDVFWAVNCGGDEMVDSNGIHYNSDYLSTGITSDFGKRLIIQRVLPEDQILYQVERYGLETFTYDIPLPENGNYVLILKFSEVYFTSPGSKVFDVSINGILVLKKLDIFEKVGHGVAHDEIIPMEIKDRTMNIAGKIVPCDTLEVAFLKTEYDNPKVNAIVLLKGGVQDVPDLLPLVESEEILEDDGEEEDMEMSDSIYDRRTEGVVPDLYGSDESYLLPIAIAITAFIPIVFCLCRM